jgi:hypothetical protein
VPRSGSSLDRHLRSDRQGSLFVPNNAPRWATGLSGRISAGPIPLPESDTGSGSPFGTGLKPTAPFARFVSVIWKLPRAAEEDGEPVSDDALDPRQFGLTAADLNDAADRLYEPGDSRLKPLEWSQETQARYGRIRSRLRTLAEALEHETAP